VLLAFHKPYGVLSQFTPETAGQRTLAAFGFPKNVYPLGRLDADSEGLLLLSDEPELNQRLLHPRHGHAREYWAQVERVPTPAALARLARGLVIQRCRTRPCRAWLLDPQPVVLSLSTPAQEWMAPGGVPTLPPRDPPVRYRKTVPTCWVGVELREGRNRQVRRMTAAIGHPTLRLIRVRIGGLRLGELPPGVWRELTLPERQALLRG